MPCGPICPASDALCIAGFKQASACQPPPREICCIGPGIVDSVEQDLYIMFRYKYKYILKAWIFFFGAVLAQSFQQGRLARSFSGNSAPIFSGKTFPPQIGAQFGPRVGGIEPATFRLQACAPPTRPSSGGQHGHTSSFAA